MICVDTSVVASVSVTGDKCPLNCKHCGGIYLRHMVPVWRMEDHAKRGKKVFLISGGMDRDGRIHFERWENLLRRLKEEYSLRYNFHVGFPPEKNEVAERLADVISADFFADPDVMEEVYGIRRTPWEILSVLRSYTKPVVPHVTVGILCGQISHEFRALEILSRNFESIIINVFIPTPGTAYEECPPPEIETVGKIVKLAKRLFKVVFIGCMQPPGKYRTDLFEVTRDYVDGYTNPPGRRRCVGDCCAFQVMRLSKDSKR